MTAPSINILELLKDGNHFAERRGALIHIINVFTGKTIALQSETSPVPLIKRILPDGTELLVQEGTPHVSSANRITAYSPLILDLICQKIAEGGALTKVCQEPGMPSYNTICRWRRKYPEINLALDEARRDRAEYLRDEVIDIADKATGDDADRLKIDARKWSSGIDDPKYSPKAKVEATINTPTQIIVHTGISREVISVTEVNGKSENAVESK